MQLRQKFAVSGNYKQMRKVSRLTRNGNGFFNFQLFTPDCSTTRLQIISRLFSKTTIEYSYSTDDITERFFIIKKGKVTGSGLILLTDAEDEDSP